MFSSVFEHFSPTSKQSKEMEQKARMGESVPNSAGAYWRHSQGIKNEKVNVEIERTSASIQVEGKVDRRTKELEKQHRQEGNWFQPEVGGQPNYQSRMVWDVTKGDEQMEPGPDHQMVWDLTNNCYHQLPVQQVSHYLPTYHQLYPCPPEELEDSVALAPTALPLVNLFGGVFMDFVDTLYTSTLVQYVCERTAPSEHRMAAEVLARSNLNPNAKEFNPSQDLDLSKQELETDSVKKSGPDAMELSPQGEGLSEERDDDEEEEVDSQEDVSLSEELKEVESCAYEQEGDLVKSSSQIEIHTVPLEAPCDNSACDIAFEENGEEKEKGKEEDEGREVEEGQCEEAAWGHQEENAPSKEEHEERVRANEESAKAEEAHEESFERGLEGDLEGDLEGEDEESEDWWDSDEEPCTPSQEIDPAEFEDLFCCPLSLTSLHPTKHTTPSNSSSSSPSSISSSSPSSISSSSTTIGSSAPPPPSSFTSVATISLAAAAPTKADTKLETINRAFNEKYSEAGAANGAESKQAKVHFSEETTWQVIEDPEELAEDLCEYRCSDLEQRLADRERQERLLGPVFMPVHRRRMYLKIYGDEVRQHQEDFEERQHQSDFKEEL